MDNKMPTFRTRQNATARCVNETEQPASTVPASTQQNSSATTNLAEVVKRPNLTDNTEFIKKAASDTVVGFDINIERAEGHIISSAACHLAVPSAVTGVVLQPVVEESSSVPKVRQLKTNSVVVSLKQRGNPILKCIRNVPWEFGDIVPDYQFNATSCALFLSLRYHNLKPNYIHERLRQLANSFVLRVLLVQVDVKDCDQALKELARICILADCTMVLAFTIEEAGRYIETYKSFENKPPDIIMEKSESNYMAQVTDTLTAVKKVNKTDAATLISAFGSFKKVVEASEKELSLCPGMGPQKASRLHKVFHQPFLKTPVKRPST